MGNKNSNSSSNSSSSINKKNSYSNNPVNQSPILFKIPQNDDPSKPLLSVIVTTYSGASYDDLFRQVPQVAPGGRVSLYSLGLDKITTFFNELINPDVCTNIEIKGLAKEMQEVNPDSVLFNFECCSGCSGADYHFPQKDSTLKLINHLLERGHMVMCSDFAVKALINDWSETLGPNPFVKLGECSDFMELFFLPKSLEESPSKQLQMVGQLCQTGITNIHAMGGTVVFGVNSQKADNQIYSLSILTIMTNTTGFQMDEKNENLWSIEDKKGTVGHALLKYKTGGILLLSAGHWIELSNLNVNIDNLEQVAMKNYGTNNEYLNELKEIRGSSSNESEKKERVQRMANKFVQQTAACNYSSFSKK